MNTVPIHAHHTSQPSGVEDAPRFLWLAMVTIVFVSLTVPYTTNLIPWLYEEGMFPLRPALYLLMTAFACLACAMTRKPDFTATTLLIVLFHVLYLFDAALLRRYAHPSGADFPMMTHGAAMLTTVALAWFLGSTHRYTRLPVMASAMLTVVICSLANVAEWFGIHSFTIVMGRAAGFWGDPNNSAIAIVLALSVFLTLSKNLWVSFALIGLSFIAVAITLSRSGIIAEILVVSTYLVIAYKKNPGAVSRALAIMLPAVMAAIIFLISHMSSAVLRESDIQDRLGALLGKDSDKMASGERMKDLTDGLYAVRLEPIAGYGTGAGSGKWQPHNQIVAVWLDGGLVLGLLFLLILGLFATKCFAAQGRGILCLLALFIFIPFSQILHTHVGFWMTALVLVNLTSSHFLSIQWFQSTPSTKLCKS